MAVPDSLPALLDSLCQSLSSAQEVAPQLASIEHQKDGISLLDVKNELLLSYLQNLIFLILLKLRNAKSEDSDNDSELDDAVRSKLVELRLYLEKGARPLEEKLRFSIERFLRTAQDAQRKNESNGTKTSKGKKKGLQSDSDDESESDEDDEDDASDSDGDGKTAVTPRRSGKSAAPNLAALVDDITARPAARDDAPSGAYRPPKRERQLMETTTQRGEKKERRPLKSHTMDEFIASEFSAAPLAEPSIGTTIAEGGRKVKTTKERKSEAERQAYEEMHFVRLPGETKKQRAQKNKEAGRSGRTEFAGEEWHNLGEGIDRIDRLTKRKDGGRGSNVKSLLEKSRKRGLDTTDGPRASGHIGDRYQKRVKLLEGGRRDRGKNR